MAKKSRRMRKLEGAGPAAPPRVPYIGGGTAPGATSTGASVQSSAASRPSVPNLPGRRGRGAVESVVARIGNSEMARELDYVRGDLRRIVLLAGTLFVLLIALALILPRVMA